MKRHGRLEGFAGQRLVVVPRPILATALHDPLLTLLLPTDAGFYPNAMGHTCVRERGCPEVIFIYCAAGAGWCEINGQRHNVAKNQLLVINAGVPHLYGGSKSKPWTIHWFHAVGSNLPFYLERLGVSHDNPVVSLGAGAQLYSSFEDLLECLQHGLTPTHLTYTAHSLAHLMGLLLRHHEEFLGCATTSRHLVEKSIEFMKSHLREPLTVAALASLAHLSSSRYTTLFRSVTGYSPLKYLKLLRMQRAIELLNSTDWPIKQISDRLGFSDQFYFSRAFRKMHTFSPSEHRRRYHV